MVTMRGGFKSLHTVKTIHQGVVSRALTILRLGLESHDILRVTNFDDSVLVLYMCKSLWLSGHSHVSPGLKGM